MTQILYMSQHNSQTSHAFLVLYLFTCRRQRSKLFNVFVSFFGKLVGVLLLLLPKTKCKFSLETTG